MTAARLQLPAIAIGGIVLAYWVQVVQMVLRSRRRTNKAANVAPPEPLGRWLRLIWMPVILLWMGVPLSVGLGAGRNHPLLRPLWSQPVVQWVAVGVAATGLLLTRRCWKEMGRSWRMGIDPAEKTELIQSGPFARVRHPIYSLSQTMMVATLVAVPAPLLIGAGLVHIFLLQWEARREEAYLAKAHGPATERYFQQVPRFIPRRIAGG